MPNDEIEQQAIRLGERLWNLFSWPKPKPFLAMPLYQTHEQIVQDLELEDNHE